MSQPIADLSYRTYEGPLNPPSARWWTIARMMTLKAWKNRFYWVLTALSGWYYLVILAIVFFVELTAAQVTDQAGQAAQGFSEQLQVLNRIIWVNQYLHGFGYAQLIYMVIALMVGAGAVANDNRANALLVYLSKPCTKLDYFVGKFFGVWIPLVFAMALPSTIFFLYGVLSYRAYGFAMYTHSYFSLLVAMAVAGALHTSILLGLSSLLKQGRLAGILYGTLYMITNIFTLLILGMWISNATRGMEERPALEAVQQPPFLMPAFYSSIDGLSIGIAKAMLGTDGGNNFATPVQRSLLVPAPPTWVALGVIFAICAFWLFVFWRRVRAVEVVQ